MYYVRVFWGFLEPPTLDFGIDVAPGINVAPYVYFGV
jgi:hypothetical protein